MRRTESESEAATEEAVDLSLIDEMLRLSPLERLQHNDRTLRTVARLRAACRFVVYMRWCAGR